MNRSKLESYMGFAAKSRNMVTGYNTCLLMMKKRQIKLLVIASDLSDNTKKKMLEQCAAGRVKYRIFADAESLSKMTGKKGKGLFGITDMHFAEIIKTEIDRIQSEREVF